MRGDANVRVQENEHDISGLAFKSQPASDFTARPFARESGIAPGTSRRRFFFDATMAAASSVASGATITSVKISTIARAASASSVRFSATMPPKAEVGSQASALR